MPRGALNWSTVNIPFTQGLETKLDPRFSSPPSLDIARDVVFEHIGGVQTRPPFGAVLGGGAIKGGGTLSNCRRVETFGDELLVFTDTAVYSWNSQISQWVQRGPHLSAAVDEVPRFTTTGDQISADRAELNGTVVHVWTESVAGVLTVFGAALDKATGAVLAPITMIASNAARPRLVALASRFILLHQGTDLVARALDPADPAAGMAAAGTTIVAGVVLGPYDVVRVGSTSTCIGALVRTVTTSYTIFTITAVTSISFSTSTKARTADAAVAVAVTPDGVSLQVLRTSGTNIQGDLITISGFADVFTGQAIGTAGGTPINQIAAAFSSVAVGGQYVCSAWWSFQETSGVGGSSGDTKFNTVTTANSIGTQSTFVEMVGVASRAFDVGGSVYVWLVWAKDSGVVVAGTPTGIRGAVQNTYYLYRSDGFLVAQAVADIAGGYSAFQGSLPGITVSGSSATFAGAWRRSIVLAGQKIGNATRSPRDITVTFDATGGRRAARLGSTLYLSGGLILQYDGAQIVEVGTLVFPWSIAAQDSGIGGGLSVGAYSWKGSIRWQNAMGETERSTTATGVSLTLAASHLVFITSTMLFVTRKQGSVRAPSIEFWRTAVNAGPASPYYLITSQDPTVLLFANNPFLPNDPHITGGSFVFNDTYSDTTLLTQEANPENVGGLEHLAPPPAQIIIATDTRIFLAGVAGDPDRVWYSRERNDGEIASFHDLLTIDVPRNGGDITAIWFQDDVLYVGRQWAIYALPGVGLDNNGQGQNFGPARIVSSDVGPVSQEAQVFTPVGTLFKSSKGWQLLERGGTVRYVGGAASQFDSDTVLSMHVMASVNQVRVLTNARMLLWDYRGAVDAASQDWLGAWAEWTVADGVHATMWNGQYVYLTASGPKVEQSSMSGLTYGLDVETSWIKMNDLQGFAQVGSFMALGEFRSTCLLRMRLARDYQYDGSGNAVYFDDFAWAPTPTTVGSALQLRRRPSSGQGRGEAFKVRLTAVSDASRALLATATMTTSVPTSGADWAATWQAVDPGAMGNSVSLSVAATAFVAPTAAQLASDLSLTFTVNGRVIVNDNFTWSATLGRWREEPGNIGVLVSGSVTVSELEAAIAAQSRLATLLTPDPSPTKLVNTALLISTAVVCTGNFAGGTYGAPSGEALRLTGLALEVGLIPGSYKRLPAEQKR